MMSSARVSASILNCDHTRLADAVLKAERAGADAIHIDIMDGVYCKNLTFGPGLISAMKRITALPLDVHLELLDVENIAPMFIKAGADIITFQLDACPNPLHALRMLRAAGVKAGIGIGPSYGVDRLPYFYREIDQLIVMSVEPGYGGQPFEESVYDKLRFVSRFKEAHAAGFSVSVDGGVCGDNAGKLKEAGADTLVVGTYLFAAPDTAQAVRQLKSV